MIAFLNQIKVPNHSSITIFRDDENPFSFYFFKNTPKISTNTDTGKPLFLFEKVTRSFEVSHDSAEQYGTKEDHTLGYLSLTVDLGLTQQEETDVRNYLYHLTHDPSYEDTIESLFPNFSKKIKKPSPPSNPSAIALSSVDTCKSGTASISTIEGLDNKTFSKDKQPGLGGNFPASFDGSLGMESTAVMLKCLQEYGATNMTINYDLDAAVSIPALSATITVHKDATRKIIQQLCPGSESRDSVANRPKVYNPNSTTRRSSSTTSSNVVSSRTVERPSNNDKAAASSVVVSRPPKVSRPSTSNSGTVVNEPVVLFSEEEIHRIFSDETTLDNAMTVVLNDKSEGLKGEKDEIISQIISSITDMVTDSLISSLFEPVSLTLEEQQALSGGETPANAGGGENTGGSQTNQNEPRNFSNVSSVTKYRLYYRLKDEATGTDQEDYVITFDKSDSIPLKLHASGTLVGAAQGLDLSKCVQEVDIADVLNDRLFVKIFTDACFAPEEVSSAQVQVEYNYWDEKSKTQHNVCHSYLFKDGSEIFEFRATKARNAKGQYYDNYRYRIKVSYIGKEPVGPNAGWSDWMEAKSDQILVEVKNPSYLTVKCQSLDIDWDVINRVIVSLYYDKVKGKPDTQGTITLTPENPNDIWTCYQYGYQGEDKEEFRYSVMYYYKDGKEVEGVTNALHHASSLPIKDLLNDTLTQKFNVYCSTGVKDIVLEVYYKDSVNKIEKSESQTFTESQRTWTWSMRLKKGASREFTYKYTIDYEDGYSFTSPILCSPNTIFGIDIKKGREDIPFFVYANFTDEEWPTIKQIFVTVKYSDPDVDYNKTLQIVLTQNDQVKNILFSGFDSRKNTCTYSAVIFTNDGKAIQIGESKQNNDSPIIIEYPKKQQ